jgi:hypothetical protein
MLSPAEEIQFWTGIMRDHGEFILNSLSYNEQDAMYYANYYMESFQQLNKQAEKKHGEDYINTIMELLTNFIDFKKLLLGKLLQCSLNTSLPPTFYNHMINEAMEFYETLVNIQEKESENPTMRNIELHNIWLPDAAGHAATIASDLDPTEKLLIKEALEFEKLFNHLAIKARELGIMLERTCLTDGALQFLNEEVKEAIDAFIIYLEKIRRLRIECKALGVILPLVPDHMRREEIHYLREIAAIAC